jgi:hypothetical protein
VLVSALRCPLNETLTVSSVCSEEGGFLKYLSDISLKPNAVVKGVRLRFYERHAQH